MYNNEKKYIFGSAHVLKRVRNNLINHNFKADDKVAKWNIQQFYDKDSKTKHNYYNSFDKMRVCYAS